MDRASLEILADKLLNRLRTNERRKRRMVSLARSLKVLEKEVSAAIDVLKSWGYDIKHDISSVEFRSAPDVLSATEICHGLTTKCLGRTVYAYKSVRSTNDLAAELAEAGAAEGTIVTAEKQTLGRGRLGRSWHSPERLGIYMSIILRPSFSPEMAPGVSLMTALAVADAIEDYCPGKVKIKWPNDILISGKKAAGILTELSAERSRISYIIVGIGVNVNQTGADFPESFGSQATSIRRSCRRIIFRPELVQNILSRLEKEYSAYKKRGLKSSLPRLRLYSSLIGREITVADRGPDSLRQSGQAVDIDESGALILQTSTGVVKVSGGEVTVVSR